MNFLCLIGIHREDIERVEYEDAREVSVIENLRCVHCGRLSREVLSYIHVKKV